MPPDAVKTKSKEEKARQRKMLLAALKNLAVRRSLWRQLRVGSCARRHGRQSAPQYALNNFEHWQFLIVHLCRAVFRPAGKVSWAASAGLYCSGTRRCQQALISSSPAAHNDIHIERQMYSIPSTLKDFRSRFSIHFGVGIRSSVSSVFRTHFHRFIASSRFAQMSRASRAASWLTPIGSNICI